MPRIFGRKNDYYILNVKNDSIVLALESTFHTTKRMYRRVMRTFIETCSLNLLFSYFDVVKADA